MILASYRNTMRTAKPVYDPESPQEMWKARQARLNEREAKPFAPQHKQRLPESVERQKWNEAQNRSRSMAKDKKYAAMQDEVEKLLAKMPDRVRGIVLSVVEKHGACIARVLLSPSRGVSRVARNEICYLLRSTPNPLTGAIPKYDVISEWMNNRDATAIIQSVALHAKENGLTSITKRDPAVRRKQNDVRYQLKKDKAEREAMDRTIRQAGALEMEVERRRIDGQE